MKTFSDFMLEVNTSMRPDEVIFREFMLEAFKAGMTKTISIMLQDEEMYEHPINVEIIKLLKERIISARDNLKEI